MIKPAMRQAVREYMFAYLYGGSRPRDERPWIRFMPFWKSL